VAKHLKVLFSILIGVSTCVAAQPVSADPPPERSVGGAVVRPVSGVSPLPAGCGLPPSGTNVLYPNTEVQPMLAQDPARPSHLVGIFQQDRWSRFGGNGAVTAYSHDGGATWTQSSNLPAFSRCNGGTPANGGDYDVTTDHWVTMTPVGTAVAASFSLSQTAQTTAILVSRSPDGGRTWEAPVTLKRDDDFQFFNDRPTVTADIHHPGTVYVTWDRTDDQSTDTEDDWVAPVWLSKSTDDGRTWTTRKVYDTPRNSGVIGTQLIPLADGTLLIGMQFRTDTEAFTQVIRSTDGGLTWSAPTLNASAPMGGVDPDPDDSGDPVRNGTFPLLSNQPGTRVVNAVWQSQHFSTDGTLHVAYAQSRDGGRTWSDPVRVDRTPVGSAAVPVIATSRTGALAVTYYDFRYNTPDPATLPTDVWAITCVRDCTRPASWTEQHVEGPFNARTLPSTGLGRLIGDYTGLVPAGGPTFISLYGVATGSATNPVDIHSALIVG
jgi:hypothetical protein